MAIIEKTSGIRGSEGILSILVNLRGKNSLDRCRILPTGGKSLRIVRRGLSRKNRLNGATEMLYPGSITDDADGNPVSVLLDIPVIVGVINQTLLFLTNYPT